MKLVLRGQPYDLEDAISAASLHTLKVLSVASAKSDGESFEPVTLSSIMHAFTQIGSESDPMVLFGDPVFLSNFQGLIFLARRKAGEKVTFDECGDFAVHEVTFSYDDADEEDESSAPKDREGQAEG